MKNRKKIICLMLLLLNMVMLHAQDSYWDMDIYRYRYDMSIYAGLNIDGASVDDYSDYEVAAFVGDECRGVGKIQNSTENGKTYSWVNIRARSNSESGETVTFKVYDKAQKRVCQILESVPFENNTVVGLPSSPIEFTVRKYMPGDVNGDDKINISDVVTLVNYISEMNPANFIVEVADVNGDEKINIADAVTLVNMITNQ